jgi:hypothetical protein
MNGPVSKVVAREERVADIDTLPLKTIAPLALQTYIYIYR